MREEGTAVIDYDDPKGYPGYTTLDGGDFGGKKMENKLKRK